MTIRFSSLTLILSILICLGCADDLYWQTRTLHELPPKSQCETAQEFSDISNQYLYKTMIYFATLDRQNTKLPSPDPFDFTLDDEPSITIKSPKTSPKAQKNTSKTITADTIPELNPGASLDSTCIDLNNATLEQLNTLPGIGKSRAQQIIDARQKRPFKKNRELTRIKGIGIKSFKKIEPKLCPIE